jgi:zinc protease
VIPAVRTVLPNGLTLLVHHAPASDVVAIVTLVRAGYFDEPDDIVGVAHVVEHMFFKGTTRFGVGEIAKATKAAGGYLNAHTIYDHTSYYTVLPAHAFERGLEIQADAYARSLIADDELARELEVIIQEAKRKEDNPSAVATERLYELLHDRHRIRRWRIGRESQLRAYARDEVHGFYTQFYRPSNTILAIAGGVKPDEVLAAVERLYGALPDAPVGRSIGPTENGAGQFRYRDLSGDVALAQLRLGWRGVPLLDPDAPALDLAASVLAAGRASRLYRAVRERELANSIGAHNYTLPDMGIFTLHLESEPERVKNALLATWGEVMRLREEPLEEHELVRARSLYEARWLRGIETMEGRANFLSAWEAHGGWERGSEYLDAVRAVTAGDLRSAVRRHLDPDNAAVLVYRPAGSTSVAGDAEELRRDLQRSAFEPVHSDPPRARPQPRPQQAELEREEGGVRVYRTRSGVPILVCRRPGLGFAYTAVYSSAGAAADSIEKSGLTLLLARTALKGTATRNSAAIAEEAERLGGTIVAAPSADAIGWSLSVPLPACTHALELLADVSQRAAFPAEALEIERSIALADLASLHDDMFSYPIRLMTQAAYGSHPYALPAIGTEMGLAAVTPDDLLEARSDRVVRGSAVVAIVADTDPDDLARSAAGAFFELGVGDVSLPPPPAWEAGRTVMERREKAQTALAIAFPGPGRRDPDRHSMDLLARVASGLGGRFFDELRDRRSLAYTVHSFASSRPLAGLFGTYIATSPEREDEAREGMLSEIERLRREPPTKEEIDRAREYAIGTELIRRESGSALLSEVVEAWLFGEIAELAEYERTMRALTAVDLDQAVEKYLDRRFAVEGIVKGKVAQPV